jgi:transcriptional regulator of acetoin/glycerol metabolism
VRLARERYFDEGQRPTGLVPEPVIQSWARCISAHRRPQDAIAFDPVSRSRMHSVLARNRPLLRAAADELQRLEAAVGATGCRVLLTDAEGVVVHATPGSGRPRELLPIVSRVGVNLAESVVGTNAPAVVLKTGQACAVTGAEHFFDSVQRLHCAAAPIRDANGGVAGVLDLTVEARPFGFDASALVGVVAVAIENRLLQEAAHQHLVLQFQVSPALLGSPLEALVGVDAQGQVAWANSTAQQLLGLALHTLQRPAAETLFGQRLDTLMGQTGQALAQPCRLPNGLTVWLRARRPGADGLQGVCSGGTGSNTPAAHSLQRARPEHTASLGAPSRPAEPPIPLHPQPSARTQLQSHTIEPAASAVAPALSPTVPAPDGPSPAHLQADVAAAATPGGAPGAGAATLGDHQRELIDKVMADCEGNISRAARRLGVSRGLLYRRRRDAERALSSCTGGAASPTVSALGDLD